MTDRWRESAGVLAAVLVALAVAPGAGESQEPVAGARTIGLNEAVRLSIQQNRELEAARLNLMGAEGRVREAWSAVYPTVNVVANYTRNLEVPGQFMPARFFDPNAGDDDQILVRFGADNAWNGNLRFEQPVFQAAAFIGVGAAARFQSLQAEVVRGKAQEIATRTRQRYYDVLLAQEAERLNQESVRRVRETLKETMAMHRAGLVGDYDVLRLEVELANLESALERSRNAVSAARRTLAVELSLEEGEELTVEGSLAALRIGEAGSADPENASRLRELGLDTPEDLDLERLLELTHRNRTELRQLQVAADLRHAELRAEQSEYLPKLSLFATYGYNAQGDGSINPFAFRGDRYVTTPQVGLQLTVPVFSGFSRPARVDQKRATLSQTRTEHRYLLAQVENQVETLVEQVAEARRRADAQLVATDQARRGFAIARAQFREGIGSRLEMTDAEVALRQSEFNYAQAIYDYLSARSQLDSAVGVVPEVR